MYPLTILNIDCGDLTLFHFIPLSNDPHGWMWHAHGNLPIGTKSCVGSVMADLDDEGASCLWWKAGFCVLKDSMALLDTWNASWRGHYGNILDIGCLLSRFLQDATVDSGTTFFLLLPTQPRAGAAGFEIAAWSRLTHYR